MVIFDSGALVRDLGFQPTVRWLKTRIKLKFQKDGQTHLYVKSAITSGTTQ